MYAWLVVSHVVLIILRVPQHARRLANASDARSPGDLISPPSTVVEAAARCVLALVWFLVLPFHCIWVATGSWWLFDVLGTDPTSLPPSMGGLPFVCFWQALGYAWIAVYVGSLVVAMQLRKRLRQQTSDLRAIVDGDVQQRWGEAAPGAESLLGVSGLASLASSTNGLTPSEIVGLPAARAMELTPLGAEPECAICLCKLEAEDEARQLVCNHYFHRACIDLWLLRQNACPLCKGSALPGSTKQEGPEPGLP